MAICTHRPQCPRGHCCECGAAIGRHDFHAPDCPAGIVDRGLAGEGFGGSNRIGRHELRTAARALEFGAENVNARYLAAVAELISESETYRAFVDIARGA